MKKTLKIVGISLLGTFLTVGAASGQSSLTGQSAMVGQMAPMVSVQNLAGDRVSTKDMEGQGSPLFLFFINTQDNTSSSAAGYINKIAAGYVPSKTKWFGICNGPADQIRAYQSEFNPPYQLLFDPTLASMQAFQAQASPTVVEIGANGAIMHIWSGYSSSMLKHINHAVAVANGRREVKIDFSKAPDTTMYGHAYIGGRPVSGPAAGGG